MTLALALGCCQIGKEKVLLNSMKGIETLSRVDVLCVDKDRDHYRPGIGKNREIRPAKTLSRLGSS